MKKKDNIKIIKGEKYIPLKEYKKLKKDMLKICEMIDHNWKAKINNAELQMAYYSDKLFTGWAVYEYLRKLKGE